MDTLSITVTAEGVAWYGAILSTITLIVGLIQHFRDSAVIKVKASEGFIYPNPAPGFEKVFNLEAVNTRRRPVTLVGCGFQMKNGQHLMISNPINVKFPYVLEEGRSVSVVASKQDILQRLKDADTSIVRVWFRSATGKIYKKRYRIKNG